MMEPAMTEPRTRLPRNRVMALTMTAAAGTTALLMLARATGLLPMPQDMSLAGVIAFCVAITAAVVGSSIWYLARTDEHDLHANLWGLSWAWIASAVATVDWAVLHEAGQAPPPDPIMILLGSAAVAGLGWLWLRFR
jgi:hypothetical protein